MKKTIKLFSLPIITIEELTQEEVKEKKVEKQLPEGAVLDDKPIDLEKYENN